MYEKTSLIIKVNSILSKRKKIRTPLKINLMKVTMKAAMATKGRKNRVVKVGRVLHRCKSYIALKTRQETKHGEHKFTNIGNCFSRSRMLETLKANSPGHTLSGVITAMFHKANVSSMIPTQRLLNCVQTATSLTWIWHNTRKTATPKTSKPLNHRFTDSYSFSERT